MKIVIGPDGEQHPVTPAVEQFLKSLDRRSLTTLVIELASYSREAMRSLELQATPDDPLVLHQLLANIDTALAGLDLDYHDPFHDDEADDGIHFVEDVIDELDRHLDTGAHQVVRLALEHLLTRLGNLGRDADNADALVGVAEHACTLFSRAVEGHPDPVGLAHWVVEFRTEYGGWPSLTLDAVAVAFNKRAWAAYRKRVAALGGGGGTADPYRSETDCMLLELADHDGDVDGAVALLSGTDHPYYGEIVKRLQAGERQPDILDWLDRAMANGKVDFTWRAGHSIIAAEDAISAYLEGGHTEAALSVPRKLFSRDLSVRAYQLLCEVAQKCGRLSEQRKWAFEEATKQAPNGDGAHLIELHLTDADTEGAWEAADSFGAGPAWTRLVDASKDTFPLRAARLCLTQAHHHLTTPDSKAYPAIVSWIKKAHSLYDRAGQLAEADVEIARIREIYRRRPALMAEMSRARLPV